MSGSISIRKLARQMGVSVATISHALRGIGRMSAETRQRILREAERMGYQPTPLLSKAFSIMRQPGERRFRETIGFITELPPHRALGYQQQLAVSVGERARSLGYLVETFAVSGKPAEQRRVSRVLEARGIRGLIILPRVQLMLSRLALNWEAFAAVEIGHTILKPHDFHRVERSLYYALLDACHLLKKSGFRRIGMAISPREDNTRRGTYSAAYLIYQQRIPIPQRIPLVTELGPWNEATFRGWMRAYRPDVLVIQEHHVIFPWLRSMGIQVPRDLSVFTTAAGGTELSGLRANMHGLGESAVEMLSLLLERDQIGIPEFPRSWLIEDLWQQGTSLKYPIPLFRSAPANPVRGLRRI